MSGYRCVNYYELCRLCTASHGTKKVHIFSEEGKQKNLLEKISGCLPIVVSETDKLPKIVCTQCLSQVETIVKFRETCIDAQKMLQSCLNSSKLRNGGKVYIKDVSPKKPTPTSPPLLKSISNTSTTITKTGSLPVTIGKTTLTKAPVQKPSTDFLSSIIQAVGIQNVDDPSDTQLIQHNSIQQPQQIQIQPQQQQQQQPVQQYTITLDGSTLKSNQIHYKIEPSGAISIQEPFVQQITAAPQQTTISNNTLAQVDEFLKLRPSNAKTIPAAKRKEQTVKIIETSPVKKQKINLVLSSPPVQNQHQAKMQTQATTFATQHNTIVTGTGGNKAQSTSLQDLKILSSGNKCYLPITIKDGSNNDQQVMAQIDTKNLVLPTTFLQMKLQPQITTVDGQQVVQLTSATSLPISIASAPQPHFVQSQIQLPHQTHQIQQTSQQQTTHIQPETRTLFTTSSGQNVTITHHPIQQMSTAATTELSNVHHTNAVEASMGKVHLTTLQNVATPNITHPLPQSSAITFQRVKVEPGEGSSTNISPTAKSKQHIFKLPTLPNTTTVSTVTTTAGKNIATKRPVTNKQTVKVISTSTPLLTTTTSTATPRVTAGNTTTLVTTTTTPATATDSSKTEVPTCDICDKVFKRKEHLAQHLKLHLGLRPFKCEEPNCNKAFSRKEHLMRHCVSHTGKKQFDCEFCHKLFSRKDNLNKHKRSHEQKQQTIVYTVSEVK